MFTFGPWKIVGESPNMIMIGGSIGCLAVAGVYKHHNDNTKMSKINEDAARLISAAPEMYELLRNLYDGGLPNNDNVKSLIAKIEGRRGTNGQ